jgi:DDE_Tnp_1-associated/Transposase DDE domain
VQSRVAGSLLALLAEIPDPRGRHGRRHPLAAMLAATVCAILTGARGYKAIAEWTRHQEVSVWWWLGFQRQPPCANSFRNLLLALSPDVLEAVLRKWIRSVLGEPSAEELRATAIDGKTLCNTLSAHERNVQLLAMFDQQTGSVLGQQAVDPSTNEAKAALGFLKELLLKGQLVTGDAMFCQRALCQAIIDSGGDYLLVVKDNQSELKEAIAAEFRPGFSPGERGRAAALSV